MAEPYGMPIGSDDAKKAAAAALAEARKSGWTMAAAVLMRPTKAFQEMLAAGGDGLRAFGLEGAIPVEGGVPLVAGGKTVGGIGLSGGSSSQDGQCARAGAEALT